MPKVGMEPIRQQQYIEATLRVIHEAGLDATTLAKVARHAGTSTGLVAHYFGDKAGLLEATFRHLARRLAAEYARQRRTASTPLERVLAVVEANLSDSLSGPTVVSAWLSFYAQVNHRPELARIQRVVTRRLQSNLLGPLATILPREDAERVATGLAVMIDGLWLRATLRTGGVTMSRARALARDYVFTQLETRHTERAHERTA